MEQEEEDMRRQYGSTPHEQHSTPSVANNGTVSNETTQQADPLDGVVGNQQQQQQQQQPQQQEGMQNIVEQPQQQRVHDLFNFFFGAPLTAQGALDQNQLVRNLSMSIFGRPNAIPTATNPRQQQQQAPQLLRQIVIEAPPTSGQAIVAPERRESNTNSHHQTTSSSQTIAQSQEEEAQQQQQQIQQQQQTQQQPLPANAGTDNTTATQQLQANELMDNLLNSPNEMRITAQQIVFTAFKLIPICLLPCLLFLYDYALYVLMTLWLLSVAIGTNERVKTQVALQSHRSVRNCFSLLVLIMAQLFVVFFMLESEQLWRYLIFSAPSLKQEPQFLRCLFTVIIVDYIAALVCMFWKVVLVIIIGGCDRFITGMQKGRFYSILEQVVQLYRIALPINIWLRYIFQPRYQVWFSVLLCIIYGVLKVTQNVERLLGIARLGLQLFSSQPLYGVYASTQDIINTGEEDCPICKEEHNTPIRLECNHVFCEECVSQWLERNQTCPICRMQVKKAGKSFYSNGNTSLLINLL